MFVGHAVSRVLDLIDTGGRPPVVIDACAAPGGKTTAVIDALPDGSLVIANEFVPARAAVLVENLTKWGYPDVIVTRGDTSRLVKPLSSVADIVIADVPCSGEGMMRKDEDAINQWSKSLVTSTARLQREIIDNLWSTLRPGGILIYSTCTFNPVENEENVAHFIDKYNATPVAIDTSAWPGIAGGIGTGIPCCRFIPGRIDGEGLFMAVLRKGGADESTPGPVSDRKAKKKGHTKGAQQRMEISAESCRDWIEGEFTLSVEKDRIVADTAATASFSRLLKAGGADVIHHGIEVATVKGRDMIPSQGLAMSTALSPDRFATVDVDRETAISYLCRESISLPDGTPRGHILLRFDGRPLGFVKNIGNRANNLYPSQWRILHR